jgi:hypothetical protein
MRPTSHPIFWLSHNAALHRPASKHCYRRVQQGSKTATFHECRNCDTVIFVTALIDGVMFGALNANCLNNKLGFSAPVRIHFGAESSAHKIER